MDALKELDDRYYSEEDIEGVPYIKVSPGTEEYDVLSESLVGYEAPYGWKPPIPIEERCEKGGYSIVTVVARDDENKCYVAYVFMRDGELIFLDE